MSIDSSLYNKFDSSQRVSQIISEMAENENPDETRQIVLQMANFLLSAIGSKEKFEINENPKNVRKRLKSEFEAQKGDVGNSNEKAPEIPKILAPTKNFFKVENVRFLRMWREFAIEFSGVKHVEKVDGILEILATFSSSRIRHVRLVATICAYSLMDGLVSAHQSLGRAQKVLRKRLGGKRGDKNESREKLGDIKKEKKSIKILLEKSFKAIFAFRYRDVSDEIRSQSIVHLGKWLTSLPKIFLSDEKMKYCGWLLNDKNQNVRNSAIKALHGVYSRKSNLGHMQDFSERFFGRILEMLSDCSGTVVVSAVKLVTLFYSQDLLDQTDDDSMVSLLWARNISVRSAAADFFVKETFLPKTTTESSIDEEKDKKKENNKTLGDFLNLLKRGEMAMERLKQTQANAQTERETAKKTKEKIDFVHSFVEAFHGKIEILNNWSFFIDLLSDEAERQNPEFPLENFLILLGAIAQIESHKKPPKNDKNFKKISEYTSEVISLLPTLLIENKLREINLLSIFALICFLDFSVVDDYGNKNVLSDVKESLRAVFSFAENKLVLAEFSKTLTVLAQSSQFGSFPEDLMRELESHFLALNFNDIFETDLKDNFITKNNSKLLKHNALSKNFRSRNPSIFSKTKGFLRSLPKSAKQPITPQLSQFAAETLKMCTFYVFWKLFDSHEKTLSAEKNAQNNAAENYFDRSFSNDEEDHLLEDLVVIWDALFTVGDTHLKFETLKSFCDFCFFTKKTLHYDRKLHEKVANFLEDSLNELANDSEEKPSSLSRYREDLVSVSSKLILVDAGEMPRLLPALCACMNWPDKWCRGLAKSALCEVARLHPTKLGEAIESVLTQTALKNPAKAFLENLRQKSCYGLKRKHEEAE